MRFSRVIEEYLKNSTLHGARFIVDKDASWIERIFWVICLVASWYASWLLIKASLSKWPETLPYLGSSTNTCIIFRCLREQCHQFRCGKFVSRLEYQFSCHNSLRIEEYGSHSRGGWTVSVNSKKIVIAMKNVLLNIFQTVGRWSRLYFGGGSQRDCLLPRWILPHSPRMQWRGGNCLMFLLQFLILRRIG